MSIIEINYVVKEYRLGQLKSFKQNLTNTFGRMVGKEIKRREHFRALDDVSFTVEQGEVLGIIGSNGAGKSTILKLLAKISTPTKGSIKVNGSVAPLIEVGAGLHPELTGRENIFLNAAILGISRSEIRNKFDEIVAFSGLEEFIDTPIKRYSSGMSVRLGFAIATSVVSDILIVDEVLAVGDLAFQRKCYDRMEEMIKSQGKTVLIVGHNIRQMERICSRMILLEHGKVLMDGDPTEVCNAYYYKTTDEKEREQHEKSGEKITGLVDGGEIEVMDISLFSGDSAKPAGILEMHRSVRIGIRFEAKTDLPFAEIIIGIHTPDFIYITLMSSDMLSKGLNFGRGVHYFEWHLADLMLKPGSYALRFAFFDQYDRMIWYGQNLSSFRVKAMEADLINSIKTGGLIDMPFTWHFSDNVEVQKPQADRKGPDKGNVQAPG